MRWKGRLFGLVVRFLTSDRGPVCQGCRILPHMPSKRVIQLDKKDGDRNKTCGLEITETQLEDEGMDFPREPRHHLLARSCTLEVFLLSLCKESGWGPFSTTSTAGV